MLNFKKLILLIVVVFIMASGIFILWESKEPKIEGTVKDKIFSVIAEFNLSNPENFYSVAKIEEFGDNTLYILQDLIKSKSTPERWAAVVLLPKLLKNDENLRNDIISTLKETVDDKDDNLRMLTGIQLVFYGEKEGIPVLISCLDSEETTHFGQPPELIKESTLDYLRNYTNYNGETSEEWRAWWEKNKDYLSWNGNKELFEVKQNK
jgi:hypothetical protein